MTRSVKGLLKLIFSHRENRKQHFGALLCLFLASVISLLVPLIAMYVIDFFKTQNKPDPGTGMLLIGFWLLLIALIAFFDYKQKYLFRIAGDLVLSKIHRREIRRHVFEMGENPGMQNAKEIAQAHRQDIEDLTPLLTGLPFWLARSVIVFILSVFLLLWINATLTLAASILILPVILSYTLWRTALGEKYLSYRLSAEQYLSELVEFLQSQVLIRVTNIWMGETKRTENIFRKYLDRRFTYFLVGARRQAFAGIVSSIAPIYLAFLVLFFLYFDQISLGEIFAFWGFFSIMIGSLSRISGQYVPFLQSILVLDKIRMRSNNDAKSGFIGLRLEEIKTLATTPLGYYYGQDRKDVLRFPAITMNKGEWVEVRGVSGLGKSTWIRLLLGLLEPTEGTIRVNGHDIKDIDRASMYERIGYVEQNGYIYSRSLSENIVLGRKYNSTRWKEIIAQTRLEKICARFPVDRPMLIGENGKKLCGGERQKILIARALYHRPEWLFLDEPFTSLDADSQVEIEEIIENIIPRPTLVLITHQNYYKITMDRVVSPNDFIF